MQICLRARYQSVDAKNFKQFAKEVNQRKAAYEKALLSDPGDIQKWFTSDYDDSEWESVPVPGIWKNELIAVDGTVWTRFELELPETAAGKPATLNLGPIDDNDVTWINGSRPYRRTHRRTCL